LVLLSAIAVPTVITAQARAAPIAPARAVVAADVPTGQTPGPLTLDQAIQYAIDHYPTVRVAIEQVNISTAEVDVARSAYLPRLDALWQSNRATANNVFGQLLPQSVIPAMSGPVLPSASAQSVWGSAAAGLFSWEPFDFGLRHAGVAGAEAGLARARAGEALTRLEVQNAVASAFLGVVATERAVSAAQADVDRRDVLRRTVQTLVDNQLRSGAEASRADAEHAAARTRLIQAQQSLTLARTLLMRVLGSTGPVTIASDALMARTVAPASAPAPSPEILTAGGASGHPLAQVRQAAVDQARAAEDALARTDFPRIYLQSSVFARGSGANPNGELDGGVEGLGLDRANWAAGVQILFPNVFDFSSLRARKAAASALARSEAALYDEALLTVTSQQQGAAALLQAARAVAANTPLQLAAAQQSESQARARYNAGLAGIVEVADAQGLLAQAEMQDQLARVDVWRALLAVAVAQGDLTPFRDAVRQP
jgi:outer membrane protein TolC